jgi:outer membrane protein assembly factor BamB
MRATGRAARGLRRFARSAGVQLVMFGVVAAIGCGCGATVLGRVFVDRNGDHVWQRDEPGVAGAVVAVGGAAFTVTGRGGLYRLDTVEDGDIVWVRVPDGYRAGPVWARARSGTDVDLGLTTLTAEQAAAPLAFVVAADAHTTNNPADPWDGGDLEDAIDQAIGLAEPPRFFTIVGDITQGNQPEQFTRVEAALSGVTVPWVPVPGNHDWYDGGAAWRAFWGPDQYSFDVGQVHVLVWDTNLSPEQQIAFVRADLLRVATDMTVVGLGHASPTEEVADAFAALGVDYLFTGHWHANRRVERTGLVEWGTQTFVMGGIDQSPSGYRVVTFDHGVASVVHRERLLAPQLAVTSPHAGSCAPPEGFDLVVAAALDASSPTVTARIDCGPSIALAARGGWTFGARIPALAPGTHAVSLHAEVASGREHDRQIAIEVCAADPTVLRAGDWPQLGGGPAHTGQVASPITPPLTQRWATATGGNVVLGSPVVKDGVVVVSVTDFGAGDHGGLVALDLITGVERWRYTTPYQVRSAAAIDGDTVVVALANGELHALGLAGGAVRWTYDLADGLPVLASSLWAAPTIADGAVFVAVEGRTAAIDLVTGQPRWAVDLAPGYPWLGTLAAVAVEGNSALATYARDERLTAWNPVNGKRQWDLTTSRVIAINATPVIADGVAYVVNAIGEVTALEVATSGVRWSRGYTPGGFDWGYSVTAAPALAGGRLFLPTQWNDLIAIDAATGAELWHAATPGGPLNFAHYRSAMPGYPASPVVTADIVWVPRPDGKLVALAAADGRELWSTELGAPLVSAPAPAGDTLIVATYDGTVHALAPAAAAVTPGPVAACPAPAPPAPPANPPGVAGCCSTGRGGGTGTWLLAMITAAAASRRRRASRRGGSNESAVPPIIVR